MLKITDLHLQRGTKILLDKANLYIKPDEKVGIIGKNGCGKSSFFSLLLRKIEHDAGDIEFNKTISVAHLAQEIEETDKIAVEFVTDGDQAFRSLEKAIADAEAKEDGDLLAELHEKMLHMDGYNIENRAAALLHGLGFKASEVNNPVKSFSGGWRMRINLAKTLMSRADFYLLDEPTNHLDLEAIVWLEKWLKSLKATLLIISHDREFLDNVVDHIAHFEQNTIKYYAGNYSSFEKQRATQLLLQQSTFEKQQRNRAHLQSFVDRFRYKASKAKQAQSRLKALERMELVSAAHVDSEFSFNFKCASKLPNPLIRLDKVSIGYNADPVLTNINLTINPGDRFGIIGPNGAGKSTLIKLLSGNLAPLSGEIFFHNDLKTGYFTQHQSEYLDITASPLLHLQRLDKSVTEQIGRNFLGQFNFHGDTTLNPITHFSGGEKARLALALLIWQKPNLLLLDEPTNHFDLDMRHALTLALQEFAGAIILISHDRHLIRATTDELFLAYQGRIDQFTYGIDDYPQCLDSHPSVGPAVKSTVENPERKKSINKKQARQEAAQARTEKQNQNKRIKTLEKSMASCQKSLADIHEQLENTSLYDAGQKTELNELLQKQAQLKKQLDKFEEKWLLLSD